MPGIEVESGSTDEAHPEIFDTRAMLPQPKEKKPGQISEELIRKYFEDGFVILENFFTKEELEPCRQETENLVDDLARKLYQAGKIKDLYEKYGLFERLTKIEAEFPGANVILHKVPNMPLAYKDIWANERLLNLIEQLIGPDIAGNPVWNLRTKTPQNEATTVPWHQDVGYSDNEAYKMMIPTAWVPLLDANEVNGCLQFAVKGHRSGKIATHQCCWGETWYVTIEDEEMERKLDNLVDVSPANNTDSDDIKTIFIEILSKAEGVDLDKGIITASVPYGGLVLFNNLIPHRSLPNMSNNIRWSLDLRWQRPWEPDGLWGLKKPVLMRKKDDPNYQIDWTEFDSVNRHLKQKAAAEGLETTTENSEFDTTIPGPWMKKWEIVHMNRHTERHHRDEEQLAATKGK